MGRILSFFRESFEELKKVVWPSRQTVVRHTVIVIVSISVAMLITAAIDFGLSWLIERVIQSS